MKYCEQCKVSVTGQRSRCPLCQSVLRDEGEPYEEVFPVIPTVYNRFQFFFKLLIFASAVPGVCSCASISRMSAAICSLTVRLRP